MNEDEGMDKTPGYGQEAAPIETIDVQFINKDDYGDEEDIEVVEAK